MFEQCAETGMVLPVKAAKEEFFGEPEDETELEDSTIVSRLRAFFSWLRECLILI